MGVVDSIALPGGRVQRLCIAARVRVRAGESGVEMRRRRRRRRRSRRYRSMHSNRVLPQLQIPTSIHLDSPPVLLSTSTGINRSEARAPHDLPGIPHPQRALAVYQRTDAIIDHQQAPPADLEAPPAQHEEECAGMLRRMRSRVPDDDSDDAPYCCVAP